MLFLVIFYFSLIGCAQSNLEIISKSYVAYRTLDQIKVDGDESDAPWSKVEWSDLFIDIEGVKKPTYNTQMKMLWDETYLYILAKLQEPQIWATLKQRDTIIFYNNDFEIFIDPDGDTYNYYELEMNALNTVWDLFISKPYREAGGVVLNDWDVIGLKSAVKVNGTINNPHDVDKAWVVELALPWSAYKTSYYDNNVPVDKFWRINFSRVNWEYQIAEGRYERKKDENGKFIPEHNWVWSPTGVVNMHLPEKWGYVYFSSKAPGAKDSFTIPQDEKIKWELYTLYRVQKAYFEKHKQWAMSLDSLRSSVLIVDDKVLQPKIENHNMGWNITIKSPFTNKLLIIKEDGQFISK